MPVIAALTDIIPYIGFASDYAYNGGIYEGKRVGNTYACHLFMSGEAHMIVDGVKIPIEKGTFVFIRPGLWHSFHTASGQPLLSSNIYCDLWEASSYKSISPQLSLYPSMIKEDALTRTVQCPELDSLPVVFSLQPFPQLVDIFVQIVKIYDQSLYYKQQAANSLFYSFMLQWYNIVKAPRLTDPRIVHLIAELEKHPEHHLSYEHWCEICGLHKSYFYILFRRETGITPGEFLLRIKMKKAAVLLQESSRSITLIAEELGFASIHYFTRQFTQYYGMNPTAFRGRNRN